MNFHGQKEDGCGEHLHERNSHFSAISSLPHPCLRVRQQNYVKERFFLGVHNAQCTMHDTLFVERWHTLYKDKIVQSTDTIYQIKPVEIVREVKHVPKFYKVCAWVLAGVVLLGVGKIVWKIAMNMR